MTQGSRAIFHYPGFGLVTGLALAALYVPLVIMTVFSFNAIRSTSSWGGFSLRWYVEALSSVAIHDAIVNTLLIGAASGTAATLLALPAAFALARNAGTRSRRRADVVLNLPLIIPEVVLGVAMLIFFLRIGLPLGYASVILAHVSICLPFALLPILVRLEGIDPALAAAARDLYASEWRVFRYVQLPLLWPGIAAGFILAFIVSIDDFIITSFVTGPGTSTLPVTIYGMSRNGFSPAITALSTMLLAASALLVLLALLLTRLSRSNSPKGEML
jgi:spermidine/putrescine transport system permease protein